MPVAAPIEFLSFTPVPRAQRRAPGQVKQANVRLFPDRYVEHREAVAFVEDYADLHGELAKVLARALLHYRDSVVDEKGETLSPKDLPLIARRDLRPLPREQRPRIEGPSKALTLRFYVDRWMEHREVALFLAAQQELNEGSRTLVRALLHYRDTVVRPNREAEQLRLGV